MKTELLILLAACSFALGWVLCALTGLWAKRHRHSWAEVKRYAVPPLPPGTEIEGFGVDLLDRAAEALQGYTVVELRCRECGAIDERRLAGDAS